MFLVRAAMAAGDGQRHRADRTLGGDVDFGEPHRVEPPPFRRIDLREQLGKGGLLGGARRALKFMEHAEFERHYRFSDCLATAWSGELKAAEAAMPAKKYAAATGEPRAAAGHSPVGSPWAKRKSRQPGYSPSSITVPSRSRCSRPGAAASAVPQGSASQRTCSAPVETAPQRPVQGGDIGATRFHRHRVADGAQQQHRLEQLSPVGIGDLAEPARRRCKRRDDRPCRRRVVAETAGRRVGGIADRRRGAGERKAAGGNLRQLLVGPERVAAAGEQVAAQTLVEKIIARQLAQVVVAELRQCGACRGREHQRVVVFNECRRAGRPQPDRPHRRPHFGDVERPPCRMHKFVHEISRRIVFRPLAQLAERQARDQSRGAGQGCDQPRRGGGATPAVAGKGFGERAQQILKRQVAGPARHRIIAEIDEAARF